MDPQSYEPPCAGKASGLDFPWITDTVFSALADKFEEVIHILRSPDAGENRPPTGRAARSRPRPRHSETPESHVQCYSLPAYLQDAEQRLLAAHGVRDLPELLGQIHDEIHCLSLLLQRFDERGTLDGLAVQMVGGQLRRPLKALEGVRSLLADREPLPEGPRASD